MEGIAYQNKDITSKVVEKELPNKSFEVYGVDLPKIKAALPTNLPIIEANELRLDNLFLFEDGSYGLVDYESQFSEEDKITYLNYLARVLKRFLHEGQKDIKIHMIVLYTSNVSNVNTELDVGSLKMSIKAGYLNSIDTEVVFQEVNNRIIRHELLSDKELMQMIVLPLTVSKKEEQKKWLKKAIEIAKLLEDERQQVFVLSGILTFSDKIIENEYAEEIRRWIQMTKVARLFELEKEEAVNEALKQAEEKALKRENALRMLLKGEDIANVIKETGFTEQEIQKLVK